MPTNLLLLPLLGGYWFLHAFQYTRFRSQRLDGYRLLVESALVGVILACGAWVALFLLRPLSWLINFWRYFAPSVPFLGVAIASLMMGIVLPYGLNWFLNSTKIVSRIDAHRLAINRHGDPLLKLLHDASPSERAISITLNNRKVYIGVVAEAPILA